MNYWRIAQSINIYKCWVWSCNLGSWEKPQLTEVSVTDKQATWYGLWNPKWASRTEHPNFKRRSFRTATSKQKEDNINHAGQLLAEESPGLVGFNFLSISTVNMREWQSCKIGLLREPTLAKGQALNTS